MRYLKNNLLIIIYMFTDRNFKLYNNLEFFVKSNTEDLNYLQNIKKHLKDYIRHAEL